MRKININIRNVIIILLASLLLIAAIATGVIITEYNEFGIIVVDGGEWGVVLPYTPEAPAIPTDQTPTEQPPTNGDPTTTPDICPVPEFTWIEVIVERAPLREIAGFNARGFPVWGIYGKSDTSSRIIAKQPKLLCAWADQIKGDGGDYAFKLISSQIVDGDYLPGDQYLYILTRMVVNSQGP